MEKMAATPACEQGVEQLVTRRRRPARSPVAPSQLAASAWRAASPFAPLVLLALVFGLSLGVVRVVERATPVPSAAGPVAAPAPDVALRGPASVSVPGPAGDPSTRETYSAGAAASGAGVISINSTSKVNTEPPGMVGGAPRSP